MKRSGALLALVFFCLFIVPDAAFAQGRGTRNQGEVLEVRLASFMPRNSDWGRALDRIAAEWARVTNNEVRLRVLHDGIEGDDAKVLSSLSSNNIQAALFASFGLDNICPSIMTLSVPFMIRNDAELSMVLTDALPYLEDQANKSNFVIVAWSRGGWVNMFSKDPVLVPDDLRRHKIATNPDAGDLNLAFKTMGFYMVETDMLDLGTRLANNMINAFFQSPAAVVPLGLYKNLRNMLDMPLAPFLGAIVVNRVTWNKISPDRQRELIRVTRRMAEEFDTTMPKTVENAMNVMVRDGLKVHSPSPAQKEIWQTELQKAMPSLLGTAFDRELYQRINVILEKTRNGNK